MHVVTLLEQSWYGDFQILLQMQSTFQLEAFIANKKEDSHFIQVYTYNAKEMINLSLNYPSFRRFLVLRAAQRRAHFLKTLHEIQQAAELESKKVLQ